jgi:hypothetical protein
MGRISKAHRELYSQVDEVCVERETGRIIVPKGTDLYCPECGGYQQKKMFVGKRLGCPKCRKSVEFLIGDKRIPTLMLKENETFIKDLGIAESVPEKRVASSKQTKKKPKTEAERQAEFDFKFFDTVEDNKVRNQMKVDEARGKDLPTFLANISKKELIGCWLERDGYDEDFKNEIASALVDRNLLQRAKKYERELNDYIAKEVYDDIDSLKKEPEEPEEPEEEPTDDIEAEYQKLKKQRLEKKFEDDDEEEEDEEEVKKKLEEKAKKSARVKCLIDSFGLDRIAKSFCSKNVRIFDTFFDDYPLTDEEKEELLNDWQFVIDYHIEDLEDYIDWLGVVMLILTNVTIVATRVKPLVQNYMAERRTDKAKPETEEEPKKIVAEPDSDLPLPKWRRKEIAKSKGKKK